MKNNQIIHGFRLIEQTHIDEINAEIHIFEHEKSGARLLHLENDDDNKLFSITFKTPPKDDTGLPHIMEHSVLCGSRKYPVKDPFVELNKGSLQTFVNAFTFADKTMYPCASRNEKDFHNLMSVYLDAALFPNIYQTPETLMQEGWHYELDDKDGEITYKGVVYNEMKGVFSSPDQTAWRKMGGLMFPDSPYGCQSGGDPDAIPQLTQEQFLAFHKKYYHPSNSQIFLYGDGNLDKQLQLINDDYLQHFDRITVEASIPMQKPFDTERELVDTYPISPEDDDIAKTYFNFGVITGTAVDPEHSMAMEILEHILLGTQASPLKQALLKAGIGKDVMGHFNNTILQTVFSVYVKNSDPDRKEEFKKIVFDTLRDLVANGINKKLIEASITIAEFLMREADTKHMPKGLFYNRLVLDSWLHGGDPTMHLRYEPLLAKIKSALTTDYFEQLIDKHLINGNHWNLLVLKPEKGSADVKLEKIKTELAEYKSSLSDKELDQLVEQTKLLKKLQQTPNSAENLNKLPLLSLDEINPKAEELPLVEREIDSVKVLSHPMFTNGIGYLNFYFDASTVSQDQIPYLSLFSDVLGKVGTDNYSYGELSNEINIHTGGIGFSLSAPAEKNNDELIYPKLNISSKVMMHKLPQLMELLAEIANNTKFNDSERILEIIREIKSSLESGINFNGTSYAIWRALSYTSPAMKYSDLIGGIGYYKFIADLEKNFAEKSDEIIGNLVKISKMIFNRNELLVSFTSNEEDYSQLEEHLGSFLSVLGVEQHAKFKYEFELSDENEAFLTPGQVQYVAKAFNFHRVGHVYSGKLMVLSKILSLDYLWNRIRVQGGAYGAGISFNMNGNVFMGSYRDPNLSESLQVYDEAEDYVRQFKASDRDISKYIIGTIGDLDHPMTPSMKGGAATTDYLTHLTQDEKQQKRDDVLSITVEDIRQFADLVHDSMNANRYCVIGSAAKINENKDLFGKLVNLFD